MSSTMRLMVTSVEAAGGGGGVDFAASAVVAKHLAVLATRE